MLTKEQYDRLCELLHECIATEGELYKQHILYQIAELLSYTVPGDYEKGGPKK
jgi:hypothetical protein